VVALLALAAMVIAWNQNSSSTAFMAIAAAFLAIVVLLLAWWWALLRANQTREVERVLRHLDQAVRLNLPLPRIMRPIAEDKNQTLSWHMSSVAAELERGAPLATALQVVPRMPVEVTDVIAWAEHAGRLPQALARLMQQRRDAITRHLRWIPFYRVYPVVLAIVFIVVSMCYFVFVVPKFQSLFHDFKTDFPGVTKAFFALASFCWPWIVVLLLGISALLIAQWLYGLWRRPGFGLVESLGGRVADFLPFVGRARRYRALANALDYCADARDAGRSFDQSIAEAAALSGNVHVARKLRRWSDATAGGAAIADASRAAGLPHLVSGMLATAMYGNGFVAVLRFLARYYRHRFTRAVALIEACAAPVIAIVMGIMVLWLALAVLAPLTTLIQSLSSPAGGPHL
jgi:type IV pilus assembly protein PilC